MKNLSPTLKPMPIDIVGGNTFGRYPKISAAQTFNMIISDDCLVPFAGYKQQLRISGVNGIGRAIYSSSKFNKIVAVIDNGVYLIQVSRNSSGDNILLSNKLNSIGTSTGTVYIAENNSNQIAICDLQSIYIFNYVDNTFAKASIDFTPGYIAFHETYFISVDLNPANSPQGIWRLSAPSDGSSWPDTAFSLGSFQTAADRPLAVIPMPGKSNEILVIGSLVTQSYYNTGAQLFPYQLNTFSNLDYGTLSAATIAYNENVAVFVAQNKVTGPMIVYTDGNSIQQISTDGINFKLAQLDFPNDSYATLFKQDGHLIYILTFVRDNETFAYDFNTKKFFTLTDHNMDAHILRSLTYSNNTYYFVSRNDGNLYELNSVFTSYNVGLDNLNISEIIWEIPRIRISSALRTPDSTRYIINNVFITLEQGTTDDAGAVDLSLSKNGGVSFGSNLRKQMNVITIRPNRLTFWQAGSANDCTFQFRFYGYGRFVIIDAMANVYQ